MINVAVVGYGYWGPNLVRNFVENTNCQVIYICERDKSKWDQIGHKYPDIFLEHDFEKLVNNTSLDAIVLATPVSTHYPLAKLALSKGKDVFVEKPLTTKSVEARELIELAANNKRILFVDHTFKYSAPVRKIKEIISNGELGEVQYITSSRINLGLHQQDISVISDLAPHDFSMLFYWIDEEPTRISVVGKGYIRNDIPDVAFINMQFPSGIVVNIHISWLSPIKLRKTLIVGSKKMLIYDDTNLDEQIKIYDKAIDGSSFPNYDMQALCYHRGNIVSPSIDCKEPLQNAVQHFLDCVRERQEPLTDGKDALQVAIALEMAEKSLMNGGQLIERS